MLFSCPDRNRTCPPVPNGRSCLPTAVCQMNPLARTSLILAMQFLFFLFIIGIPIQSFSQSLNDLDGKWCFTGVRTTVFNYRQEKLFIGLLDSGDTLNFKKFIENKPLDTSLFVEAIMSRLKDTVILQASFPKIKHDLKLAYTSLNQNMILYTGDVYFDSTSVIITNKNCQLQNPFCLNKLYSRTDIDAIAKMKPVEKFTRDDAFEFLLRLSLKLKDKCNRCYAGFTDAYMNEVLIDMGFNPITSHRYGRSIMYSTSGFTFYMKTKFATDKPVENLSRFLLEQYINAN